MVDLPSNPFNQASATFPRLTRPLALRAVAIIAASALMALLLMAHRAWPFDVFSAFGMFVVSGVAVVLTRFHLRHTPLNGADPRTAERMIWLVALLSVSGVQLMTRALGSQELLGLAFLLSAPLVAQAMLTSALLGPTVSLFAVTVVTFLLGVSRALPIETLAASWLASAVGAHSVNPLKQRSDLLRAVSVQVVAQAVIACCITAVSVSEVSPVLESAGWAAVAAVGATSVFWLGVAILEKLFGVASDWSLLELCSPDQPLIKQLCLNAPGSYAHSVMVGNLAENAARVIGANPVLCRAMAYFHDVGKLMRPSFFVENQIGENVHDGLSPKVSAMVIASHVTDGLDLAKQHGLPQVIRDGIAQHHGTSLIGYFYNRALKDQAAEDLSGLERYFRYTGPKPQTRESAILSLADSVEAVSRTIPRSKSEELETMIYRIVEERRADGQLDECELTLRELRDIQASFLRSLCATRHERIVYPYERQGGASGHPQEASHFDLERIGSKAIASFEDTYGA